MNQKIQVWKKLVLQDMIKIIVHKSDGGDENKNKRNRSESGSDLDSTLANIKMVEQQYLISKI